MYQVIFPMCLAPWGEGKEGEARNHCNTQLSSDYEKIISAEPKICRRMEMLIYFNNF